MGQADAVAVPVERNGPRGAADPDDADVDPDAVSVAPVVGRT